MPAHSPTDFFNNPALQQAQQGSQQASSAFAQATNDASTLPKMLEDALKKKFSQDNPLVQQREGALENFLTVSETAPQNVLPENNEGRIFSPLAQAGMIRGERAGALAPLVSINDLLAQQRGGISNVVGETTDLFRALAEAAGFKADSARQNFQDLFGFAEARQSQSNTDRNFNENVRQFGLNYALAQQQENRLGNALDDEEDEADKKRTAKVTDEYIQDMQFDVQEELDKNPDADPKHLIWTWINENEPFFGSAGVDAEKLWEIWKRTPDQPQDQSSQGGGLFDFIGNLFK